MSRHRRRIIVLLCMIALFSTSTYAKKKNDNNNKHDKRYARTTNGKREKDEDTSKRDDKRNARNNNNPKNIVEELIIPRSVTRTFPICKRYANQNRQRLLIKGTETKSPSLLVGSSLGVGGSEGEEEEERILRRRQGNPMKITNPNKANTSRTSRGQQQQLPQRGNNAKKRQQKRTNARQRKRNKQRNSNNGGGSRGTGRLQNNNRQYNKINQRNSGGVVTKKQSTIGIKALNWFGDEDTSTSKPALKARKKKREANVKRVRKPTNTKPSNKEPTKTPKQMQMGQGYKPNYGYYPDFDNDICISDESYPNYMKTDVEFYFSTTINECCRLHYKGSVKDCLDVSMKVAKKTEWKEPQGWGKAAMPKEWGAPPPPPGSNGGTGPYGEHPPPPGWKAPGIMVDAWGKPYENQKYLQTPSGAWGSSSAWKPPPGPPPPLPPNGGKPIVGRKRESIQSEQSRGSGKSGKSGSVAANAVSSRSTGSKDERLVIVGWKAPPPAWKAPVWNVPPPIKCNKWGGGGWSKPCTYMPTYVPTYMPTYPETYTPTPGLEEIEETPYPTYGVETEMPTPKEETETPTTLPPTLIPTFRPTLQPTEEETEKPTSKDETLEPTLNPTFSPTLYPTTSPTLSPTYIIVIDPPTLAPSLSPTLAPTISPSLSPTFLDDTPVPTPATTTLTPTIAVTDKPIFESARDIYAWGAPESFGEEGPDVLVPQDVEELVLDVSAGSDYTLLILADGSAAVGGNIVDPDEYQGHFGCGCAVLEGPNPLVPIVEVIDLNGDLIPAPPIWSKLVAGADSSGSGRMHSVFIDDDGNVYAAGNNDLGQLCLGDDESRIFPTQIELPNNERAESAAVGGDFTLILGTSGTVYGCGSFFEAELEDIGLVDVKTISAGLNFALIHADDGLYVMGDNTFGQLCLDTGGDSVLVPTILAASDDPVSSDSVLSFKAGAYSSYILFDDGTVDACGSNLFGQLGDGTNEDASLGVEVILEEDILSLYSGPSSESVFFIGVEGNTYGTGLNDRGQLGVGDTQDRNLPTLVDVPPLIISASSTHTAAF